MDRTVRRPERAHERPCPMVLAPLGRLWIEPTLCVRRSVLPQFARKEECRGSASPWTVDAAVATPGREWNDRHGELSAPRRRSVNRLPWLPLMDGTAWIEPNEAQAAYRCVRHNGRHWCLVRSAGTEC